MDRRSVITHLGASAAGLLALNGAALAQKDQPRPQERHLHIIDECARVCAVTAHHCLDQLRRGEGDKEVHARAHALTLGCEAFCRLASSLAARHNPLASYAHAACADACRDCAQQCAKGKDEVMARCVEACRKCEEVCRIDAKTQPGAVPGVPAEARP